MTFDSFALILRRQFTQKWGRFLLASGGIMIGIWAITLTSGLSFGVADTIVKAINSQAGAREISLSRTEKGQTSFLELSEAPTFSAMSLNDFKSLQEKNPNIVSITPDTVFNLFVQTEKLSTSNCVEIRSKIVPNNEDSSQVPGQNKEQNPAISPQVAKEFEEKCKEINVVSNSFTRFYEYNKKNWIGSSQTPKRGEIVTCFKCGSLELHKQLKANSPQELLGKEITVEMAQAPLYQEVGKVFDTLNPEVENTIINTPNQTKLKIVGVIDDRDASVFATSNTNFFVDTSYFIDAVKLLKPNLAVEKIGFIQAIVYIDDYNNLDKVIKSLQDEKYLPFSIVQALVNAVKVAFNALAIVLSGFGLIALVASIFGIVNVMTISVLERKKEIGILKSLGARDRDIFNVFLFESAMLGFIGWLLGTVVAVLMGQLITWISRVAINNNSDWKENLSALNITEFGPTFPWWLLLGTLALALIFTVVSGVFPALRASNQNPVDVLRSE